MGRMDTGVDPPQVAEIYDYLDSRRYKDAVKQADLLLDSSKAQSSSKKTKKPIAVTPAADLERVRILKCLALIYLNRSDEIVDAFKEVILLSGKQNQENAEKRKFRQGRTALLLDHLLSLVLSLSANKTVDFQPFNVLSLLESAADFDVSQESWHQAFVKQFCFGKFDTAFLLAMKLYTKTKNDRYAECMVLCALLGEKKTNVALAERILDQCGQLKGLDGLDGPQLCDQRRIRFRRANFRASILYRKEGPEACIKFLCGNSDIILEKYELKTLTHTIMLKNSLAFPAEAVLAPTNVKELLHLLSAKTIPLRKIGEKCEKEQNRFLALLATFVEVASLSTEGRREIAAVENYKANKSFYPEQLSSSSSSTRTVRLGRGQDESIPIQQAVKDNLPLVTIGVELMGFVNSVFDLRAFFSSKNIVTASTAGSSCSAGELFYNLVLPFLWDSFCCGSPTSSGSGPELRRWCEGRLLANVVPVLGAKPEQVEKQYEDVLQQVVINTTRLLMSSGRGGQESSRPVVVALDEIAPQLLRHFEAMKPKETTAGDGSSDKLTESSNTTRNRDDFLFLYAVAEAERLLAKQNVNPGKNGETGLEEVPSSDPELNKKLLDLATLLDAEQSETERTTRRAETLQLLLYMKIFNGCAGGSASSPPREGADAKSDQQLVDQTVLKAVKMFDKLEIKNILLSSRLTALYFEYLLYDVGRVDLAHSLQHKIAGWHAQHCQEMEQYVERSFDTSLNPDRAVECVKHSKQIQKSISLAGAKMASTAFRLHSDIVQSGTSSSSSSTVTGAAQGEASSGRNTKTPFDNSASEAVCLHLLQLELEGAGSGDGDGEGETEAVLPTALNMQVESPPWIQHCGGLFDDVVAPTEPLWHEDEELLPLIFKPTIKILTSSCSDREESGVLPQLLKPNLHAEFERRYLSHQVLQLCQVGKPARHALGRLVAECEAGKEGTGGKNGVVLAPLDIVAWAKIFVSFWSEEHEKCEQQLSALVGVGEENSAESGDHPSTTRSAANLPDITCWRQYLELAIPVRLAIVFAQSVPKSKNKKSPMGQLRVCVKNLLQKWIDVHTEVDGSVVSKDVREACGRRARQIKDFGFKA
ncbi:unnamed protein product [Amoebophrya sp. A120]|nr:unnamed protein product [Amoebophrya sp. A120]|eukprot:GSA120T00016845001.1